MNQQSLLLCISNIFISHGKEVIFAIGTISIVNWSWPLYSSAVKRCVKRLISSLLILLYQQYDKKQQNRDDIFWFVYIRRMFYVMGSCTGGFIGYKIGKLCHECGVVARWAPSVGTILGTLSGCMGAIFVWMPVMTLWICKMVEKAGGVGGDGLEERDDAIDSSSMLATGQDVVVPSCNSQPNVPHRRRSSSSSSNTCSKDSCGMSSSTSGAVHSRGERVPTKKKQGDWWDQHEKDPILALASYFQTAVMVQAENRINLRKYYTQMPISKYPSEEKDSNCYRLQPQQQQYKYEVYRSKLAKAEKRFLFGFSIILTWLSLNTVCWFEWMCMEWEHEEGYRHHVLVLTALLWAPSMYILRFMYAVRLYRRIRRIKGQHQEPMWKTMAKVFSRPMVRNACDLFESASSLPMLMTQNMTPTGITQIARTNHGDKFAYSAESVMANDSSATGSTESHKKWYCWRSPDGRMENAISYRKLYFVLLHGAVIGPVMGIMFGTYVGKFINAQAGHAFDVSYLLGLCSGIVVSVGSLYSLIFHSEKVLPLVLGKSVTCDLYNLMEVIESNILRDWHAFWFPTGNTDTEQVKRTKDILSSVVLVGKLKEQTQIVEDVATGFFVDLEQGLIMTALHTFCDIEKLDDPGNIANLNKLMEGYQIIVGINQQRSDYTEAKFMYHANIIKAGSKGVDACILKLAGHISTASQYKNSFSLTEYHCKHGDLHSKEYEKSWWYPQLKHMTHLQLQTKFEVEDSICLIGFDQDGDGLISNDSEEMQYVGRRVGIRKGYVSRQRADIDTESHTVGVERFIPRSEILVICMTKKGNSGGPCLNDRGEVIGMCSRIDPMDLQRCFLVPSSMLKELMNGINSWR